jgi:RND family efflux transporter MFP subunit
MQQELGRLPTRRQALQATLDRLRADADLAEENLRRTTISSPISGVLQSVSVEPGELVGVGAPIARVVDLSRIEAPLRAPASALGQIRIGDEAALRADGPAAAGWTGAVSRIAPEADQATRTLTVFVEVRQDPGVFQRGDQGELLLPGQFVTGTIRAAADRPRTLVPRRAVVEGSLFIAEPGPEQTWAAHRVPVEVLFHTTGAFPRIDPLERQWAVLATPIPEGTPIIVTNLDDLTEGRYVEGQPRIAAEDAP